MATGSKDPSAPPGGREEPGGGAPEAPPAASISSAQLVRVAADLDRLQEQVSPSGAEPAAGRSVAGECVTPAPPHAAAETGGASAGPLVRPRQRASPSSPAWAGSCLPASQQRCHVPCRQHLVGRILVVSDSLPTCFLTFTLQLYFASSQLLKLPPCSVLCASPVFAFAVKRTLGRIRVQPSAV